MKCYTKHIWKVLFGLTGAVGVWVGAVFLTKAFFYYQLSHATQGQSLCWGVFSGSEERHYLYVDYRFTAGGESRTARYVYPKPAYSSRAAAEAMLEDKRPGEITVWYGKPHESSLERAFPMKDLVRLVVVLAVLLYFFLLRNYLQNFLTTFSN